VNVAAFLRELRELLAAPASWHPTACANREGFQLTEYQQAIPGPQPGTFDGPTWHVPVRWNLPCAITYLLGAWENWGRFAPASNDKVALRLAVVGVLAAEAGTAIWFVTEHAVALAAIEGVLVSFAQDRSAA
jgi:hypothetical protein